MCVFADVVIWKMICEIKHWDTETLFIKFVIKAKVMFFKCQLIWRRKSKYKSNKKTSSDQFLI